MAVAANDGINIKLLKHFNIEGLITFDTSTFWEFRRPLYHAFQPVFR